MKIFCLHETLEDSASIISIGDLDFWPLTICTLLIIFRQVNIHQLRHLQKYSSDIGHYTELAEQCLSDDHIKYLERKIRKMIWR